EKRGEELDRLAETHVVGETGAEAAREQETQPSDAPHLIGAQGALQAAWRGEAGDLAPRDLRIEETPDPPLASHGVDEDVLLFAVEPAREAQQLAERGAAAGPAVEEAPRLLEILLVEENPLPPDLDEGNLPGGQLLELVGGEERIAHGHAPIEVDEGVETEAHDGRVGFARSGRARHELERDAREAAAAGQADGDAGLPEKRGLVGQKAPRFVRRQDDTRGMPLLETPRDRTRERRGRSEPREKRVLRVREQAPAPPHRAILRGPDLLGRERDLGAFSGLEDVRERKRAAGLGWRHDADSEAQQALGQGIQKREAPLGQARKDAGLERTGRRSGERGDDLGLGRVARAAPLGRKDVPEDVARRRVHGLVEKREEQPARGRERAVGSQAYARRQNRARHRRHGFGETPQTLPLVGIVEDRPPAGMRAVGSRRGTPPGARAASRERPPRAARKRGLRRSGARRRKAAHSRRAPEAPARTERDARERRGRRA